MARHRLFTDVVAAALVAAAASAPVAGLVAYWNHNEAMVRIQNERLKQDNEARLSERRLLVEQRQAQCTGALTYLEDEKPNPALPAAKAQLLIEDMRHTASSCSTMTGAEPTSVVEMPSREVHRSSW